MAYCIKPNENAADAVRRIVCERLERARESLKDCSEREAIHRARREIKRARATLRLGCAIISKKDFQRIERCLRQAADGLASARDAVVKAETMRLLEKRFAPNIANGGLRELRKDLQHAAGAELKEFAKSGCAQKVRRILRRASKEFGALEKKHDGYEAIAAGVKAGYKNALGAFEHAEHVDSAKAFHEWRKRVKYLLFELKLLRCVCAVKVNRMARDLDLLGELLGEDHDLFILQSTIRRIPAIEKALRTRQRELRAKALRMGKAFFAGQPAEFSERITGNWRGREN